MASVSNAFDALQNAPTSFSTKKKKRNRKKTQSTTSDAPSESSSTGPQLIPSSQELEAQATAAVTHDGRRSLWERWATTVLDEASMRRGQFVDENSKPTTLRKALLLSRALEALAESCVDAPVTEDESNALYRLLNSVLTTIESEVVQQLVFAIMKVSSLARGKGAEVLFASKRALRDVLAAVKQVELREEQSAKNSWKKKKETKQERAPKKTFKQDKKAEIHEAMETVKSVQTTVDDMAEQQIGVSASRAVSDLQVALSYASKPVIETAPETKKGKKGKKQSQPISSPLLESLKKEEAAYAAEETRLNEEISNMEMKLRALRSQLTSLHVTRQQVQQRKEAIMQSQSSGHVQSNGAAQISQEDQNDAIECLESVISHVDSTSGQSDEQKRDTAIGYIDALNRFFTLCISRQEDFLKNVKFLKDAIQRRLQQEEKMKEISSAALAKDILKSQQHSKNELEQQLKDVMFDSGDLMIKVTRVESDLEHRAEFLRKYVHPSKMANLEESTQQIKGTHNQIKLIAAEKREVAPVTPKDAEPVASGRKRIDTKEIIKEEEAKAREAIAAKFQPKQRSTAAVPHSVEQNVVPMVPIHPVPPPVPHYPPAVYMTQPVEAMVDPRYGPPPPTMTPMYPPPQYAHLAGPPPESTEVERLPVGHPVYPPPMNPAAVAAHSPPPQPAPEVPSHTDAPPQTSASGSARRMPWKKIGEQHEADQTDLPTPGEARKQGKL